MKTQNKSQLDIAKDLLEVECIDWQRFLQKHFPGTKISTEAIRSIILSTREHLLSEIVGDLYGKTHIISELLKSNKIHEKNTYRSRS